MRRTRVILFIICTAWLAGIAWLAISTERADSPPSGETGYSGPPVTLVGAATFTGRVRAADGRARSGTPIHVAWSDARRPDIVLVDGGMTDATGRFAVPLPGSRPVPGRLRLRILAPGDGGTAVVLVSEVLSLDIDRRGQPPDLGDVLLSPAQAGVTGVVVDETGTPVAGATVAVVASSPAPDLPTLATGPLLVRLGFVRAERATTDAQGRFAIDSGASDSPVILRALAPAHRPSADEGVRPGDGSVRLVLTRIGTLVGSLRLPAGCRAGDFEIQAAVLAGQGPGGVVPAMVVPDAEGRFVFADLPPGMATITVRVRGEVEPAVTVDAVLIPAGIVAEDARLSPVDPSAGVQVITLTVKDERGGPIAGARILGAQDMSGTGEDPDRTTDRHGRVSIVTAREAIDVVVFAPARRPVVLENCAGASDIILAPGPEIRLQLPESIPPPAPPLELVARLTWAGGRDDLVHAAFAASGADGPFDDDGCARIQLPGGGKWRLDLVLVAEDSAAAVFVTPAEIVVSDPPETAEIAVVPADGALAAALRALGR